jgi:hypothetical protein
MNMRPQESASGVRSLVRVTAENGSVMGTWNQQCEQTVLLERSGSVDMPDFNRVSAVFEAKRYFDQRHRLRTLYLARVAGSRELVIEEMSEDLKARFAREIVSASVSEAVIKTDTMSTERDSDGDPMEFLDEDGYHHTQTVEYRINGNGEILECVRSDEYFFNDESTITTKYSEPYQRGKLAVSLTDIRFNRDAQRFDAAQEDTLASQLTDDLILMEQLDDFRNDREMIARSRREHQERIFAITAFVTMQADPIKSLQIALS